MRFIKYLAATTLAITLTACGTTNADLPEHDVDISALGAKDGQRVQVNVNSDISKEQCITLIDAYKSKAAPDGQVSVHKPSQMLEGQVAPYCVENFDGAGVRFNDTLFKKTTP